MREDARRIVMRGASKGRNSGETTKAVEDKACHAGGLTGEGLHAHMQVLELLCDLIVAAVDTIADSDQLAGQIQRLVDHWADAIFSATHRCCTLVFICTDTRVATTVSYKQDSGA